MEVNVKRNVVLRAVVTPKLREEITREVDQAIEQIDQRVEQIDVSTKFYLAELQRTNLQQAINVRKQIEAEKQKHQDLRIALQQRKEQIKNLEDGQEIIRGALESFVTVKPGDNLAELLGGVEIVVKDDLVEDIRQHLPELETTGETPTIITDLSGGLSGEEPGSGII